MLICIFVIHPIFAQNITFSHITTENGLSQITANSLYIDENGFVWIGTREGLNCYNGREIKTFQFEKNNPDGLFSNHILRVTGNQAGKIYMLCTDGLAEYDLIRNEFTTLLSGSISTIHYHEKLYIGKKMKYIFLMKRAGILN